MPRKDQRGARWQLLHAPATSDSVAAWVQRYLEAMQVMGRTRSSLSSRTIALAWFNEWCVERALLRPIDITKPILERWQRHLFYYRKQNGQPLSVQAQRTHQLNVRAFFRWMARHGHLPHNPASDLDLPLAPMRLLPEPLNQNEIEKTLSLIDVEEALGLRDRAIIELLYSTGLRRTEAMQLTLYDIDPLTRVVRVRQGKGRRDRVVPIGERALAWLQKYLEDVRPEWAIDPKTLALFLTQAGTPLGPDGVTVMVRKRLDRAEIHKTGSCHLFRHAMATLMLEHGADVRYIQEMLGHAELSTTQIYTHVSITKLREVHEATHPAAKLGRRPKVDRDDSLDADDDAGEISS
jgi:integrase/recombinase XerD